MASYTNSPITIHAVQWFADGNHHADYCDLENGEMRSYAASYRYVNDWDDAGLPLPLNIPEYIL